ncbi:MAG: MBL fold metallo-hydrolase [Coriobacteriales bacterium]|nr:MBL fold metallo-hydrolase [Coriobacteriales bacterium]
MDKQDFYSVQLTQGEILVYDFGSMRLHNYNSNDPLNDQVILLEQGGAAIAIENPSFINSVKELSSYLQERKIKVVAKLLAYHMCGAEFLPEVPVYSTRQADIYGHSGDGAAMVKRFAKAYEQNFSSTLSKTDVYLKEEFVRLGGFEIKLIPTTEAFDVQIAIPQGVDEHILYMHMLGNDCHSIVTSKTALDAMVLRLSDYLNKNYSLILSSHHLPENNDDIQAKISYLRDLDTQARSADSANEFIMSMQAIYPKLKNREYLQMTAGYLFGD